MLARYWGPVWNILRATLAVMRDVLGASVQVGVCVISNEHVLIKTNMLVNMDFKNVIQNSLPMIAHNILFATRALIPDVAHGVQQIKNARPMLTISVGKMKKKITLLVNLGMELAPK
tara:strand:- start:59 stop:409 length:351 start_codon:yes stop_codon:yes gene_type:complete